MKKKKYEIEITEILSRVVEVKAESRAEAIDVITEKYKTTEIVLDYNDFVEVNFMDVNTQSHIDEKDKLVSEIVNYLYEVEKKHFEESENKPENHIFL